MRGSHRRRRQIGSFVVDVVIYLLEGAGKSLKRLSRSFKRWLARRHLASRYHRMRGDQFGDENWNELAVLHLEQHVLRTFRIEHCYWTPTIAHPSISGLLLMSVGLSVPLLPVAGLVGWVAIDSFTLGVLWGARILLVWLIIYFLGAAWESLRIMFIPPDRRRLEKWADYLELTLPTIPSRYVAVSWDFHDDMAGVPGRPEGYNCHPSREDYERFMKAAVDGT